MPNASVKVWYDSACPLCLREISLMRKLDTKSAITFIDILSPNTDCPINKTDLLARFHAEENGVLVSGAAAFATMWRAIPMLRPLGLLARNKMALFALEACYIFFLKHRPKLQRLVIWLERKTT